MRIMVCDRCRKPIENPEDARSGEDLTGDYCIPCWNAWIHVRAEIKRLRREYMEAGRVPEGAVTQ